MKALPRLNYAPSAVSPFASSVKRARTSQAPSDQVRIESCSILIVFAETTPEYINLFDFDLSFFI